MKKDLENRIVNALGNLPVSGGFWHIADAIFKGQDELISEGQFKLLFEKLIKEDSLNEEQYQDALTEES